MRTGKQHRYREMLVLTFVVVVVFKRKGSESPAAFSQ